MTRLTDGSDAANAMDIEVKNGDVILGVKGQYHPKWVYWKNGTGA